MNSNCRVKVAQVQKKGESRKAEVKFFTKPKSTIMIQKQKW